MFAVLLKLFSPKAATAGVNCRRHAETALSLEAIARGNPGKRPIRPEPEPAVPTTPPDPPEFLDEHAKNEWWRVAPKLHALGSLTVLDLQPLAAYCQAYAH